MSSNEFNWFEINLEMEASLQIDVIGWKLTQLETREK